MDARTGVQRQQPSKPVWIVSGEAARPRESAIAVADQAGAKGTQGGAGDGRLSVDPMRATDRYRLVMPYSEEV